MTKTIKNRPWSNAGIVVDEETVRVTVKEDKGVLVDGAGVTVQGPVSFESGTNQIRVAGLWTFNHSLRLTLPSTLATPSPVLTEDPPTDQIASLMEEAAIFIGLLGMISGI